MGSPPRAWENNEDIMEVENLYSAFFARDNIDILNDVPDILAAGLRITSRFNPPPEPIPPVPPAIPLNLVNIPTVDLDAEDSVSDAADEDYEDYDAYEDDEDSRSSSAIMMSINRTTPRPGRFSESSNDSSEESLIGFPIDPPAGSPVGFPIESPMDSLATSPETSPESSVVGSPVGSRATSPVGSRATSPTRCPATTSATSLKRAYDTLEDENSKADDEAFSCSICLDTLTNTGLHRPACLKCGHIFGENCLQRWIKTGCNRDAKRCPTCNRRANVKDIRVLYAKNLVAVDTAEVTALELKVEKENREKNLMHLEAEKWKVKATYLDNEVKRLKTMVDADLLNKQAAGPTSLRQCIKKINLCKNLGCRVMAYNKYSMMLVVSQHSESPLFNSHVIRKLNGSILEASKECIFAHKKQIRDMAFHPYEHNLLASVSLDKCISLMDVNCNQVISSVDVNEPLWSCCWAGDNTNMLVAGGQMGSLYYIDRRYMKLFNADQSRKLGCVSLISIPPSTSRAFIHGGFMKTRMDYLSMFEQEPGKELYRYTETELPLKGLWTNTSYDYNSNLVLSSAKPCGPNKSVRHIVSKIADHNTEGPVITPVVTFYGGDKATQLSRSCLVPTTGASYEDTLACSFDERSKTIKVFNVNQGNNTHNFHVKENFLDLCPLTGMMNSGRRMLAGLSENAVSLFTV
ncbi:E3 ubiquitin-protein ligase RFWD3-like isoform X2 [Myzus persicae]|nr:E3 ubiquitin-protein ligase RFWD3-like isoform X2 [Myzus persicae]XP_022181277.1 E3 ubiquitin-protein ligase RFWD3-like isoform X2 [Myzus persicae]